MKEHCTLVIIGAGYAGVCALNAAAQYLKPGDTVVVVDQVVTLPSFPAFVLIIDLKHVRFATAHY